MFYKEWLGVRLKFYMLLVLYGVAGLGVTYSWIIPYLSHNFAPPISMSPYSIHPLFQSWLNFNLLSIIPIAVLCGVDTVADETDKGTLSFLLTRAIPRSRIYTAKILLNIIALAAAYLSISGIVLLIDQLHPRYIYERNTRPLFLLESVNIGDALSSMLVVLLAGTTVTVLTSLASIFTRSTMQSLLLSVIMLLVSVVLFNRALSDIYYDFSFRSLSSNLPNIFWFLVLTVGLYRVGLFCFERKEF